MSKTRSNETTIRVQRSTLARLRALIESLEFQWEKGRVDLPQREDNLARVQPQQVTPDWVINWLLDGREKHAIDKREWARRQRAARRAAREQLPDATAD